MTKQHHCRPSSRSLSASPTSSVSSSLSSCSSSEGRGVPVTCCVAVGLFAALLFLNTLTAGFAYDDSRAILSNPDLHWKTPLSSLMLNDFWGTPLSHTGSHKSYRPLAVLSFRLNYYLHQLRPMGYHLANVILHAITSSVFTRFVGQLFRGELRPALIAGLLFAAHPVHCEAVASVVGRADVGSGLFFLLALMSYTLFCDARKEQSRRRHLYLSLVLAAAAMLTKETGITVLAVCGIYHVLIHHKVNPASKESMLRVLHEKRFASLREGFFHLTGGGILLLILRLYLMGLKVPDFAAADNPAASAASPLTRTLTFLFLPVVNLVLLLFPRWLSFDWSMEAIPLITSLVDWRNVSSLIFYSFLFLLVRNSLPRNSTLPCLACSSASHKCKCRSKGSPKWNNNNSVSFYSRCDSGWSKWNESDEEGDMEALRGRDAGYEPMLMAVTLMIFSWLPASNLFFYVGFVVAERILYIPSMGFCLLIASGMEALMKRKTSRFITSGSLIALSILLMSFSARTFVRNIDWSNEERLYTSGIAINPPKAYGNLGNILSSQGNKAQAERCYRKALTFRSNMADVHYNLGILLQEQGRLEEALQAYENAIRFRPRLAVAHLNMGLTLTHMGRRDQAIDVYRRCASLDGTGLKDPRNHESTKVSALFNLGRLYSEDNRFEEAIATFKKAIETMPAYYQSHSLYNMMGEAFFKLGQFDEAETWYLKALRTKSDHVPAHLTLAKLYAKINRSSEAEKLFIGVQALAPNDSSVYQHYGQFLADNERFREAAEVFMKGTSVAPRDFDLVFGAANMLRQARLHDEAEKYYKWAVRLKPDEVTSHMNLGAMLHLNGKLREAENEYLHALRLRPNDNVTQVNLAKLRLLMQRRI